MENMPVEILDMIVEHVEFFNRYNLISVNKLFHQLCLNRVGIKSILCKSFYHIITGKEILGDGIFPEKLRKEVTRSGANIIRLVEHGEDQAIVITNDNIYCWGDIDYSPEGLIPSEIKLIACGRGRNIAVTYNDKIYQWGTNLMELPNLKNIENVLLLSERNIFAADGHIYSNLNYIQDYTGSILLSGFHEEFIVIESDAIKYIKSSPAGVLMYAGEKIVFNNKTWPYHTKVLHINMGYYKPLIIFDID